MDDPLLCPECRHHVHVRQVCGWYDCPCLREEALIASTYRPGDMAHPVRGTDWHAAFHDPDNWLIGIILALMIVIVVMWIGRPPA